MSIPKITVSTKGLIKTDELLQRYRNGLASRKYLHAKLAVTASAMTRDYLRGVPRHKTATSLGAQPTNHMERSAKRIESDSNEEEGIMRIPKSTGLGRAFHDIVILPGSGKVFLAIPADAQTYGKTPREFPVDAFAFTIVGGRFPALMWRKGWTVAYWLARSVTQKQDRTLLPSDDAYRQMGRGVLVLYLRSLSDGTR